MVKILSEGLVLLRSRERPLLLKPTTNMEFINQLLGQHTLAVWSAGIIWSLMGIIAVKIYFIDSGNPFVIRYWINDNLIDILKGIFWALVILRLGDYAVHLLQEKFEVALPFTDDFIIIMIVISGLIQWKLHKNRKPISKTIQNEMHEHNENCKH